MIDSKRVAEALSAEIERLHAKIDDAIRACIYDRAAEISGVPVQVIKERLIARSAARTSQKEVELMAENTPETITAEPAQIELEGISPGPVFDGSEAGLRAAADEAVRRREAQIIPEGVAGKLIEQFEGGLDKDALLDDATGVTRVVYTDGRPPGTPTTVQQEAERDDKKPTTEEK